LEVRAISTVDPTRFGIATVNLVEPTMPAPPTGVRVDKRSETSITLTWNPVTGADSYIVYRRTGTSGNFSRVPTGQPIVDTQFVDIRLSPDTEYQYHVSAVNGAGESALSLTHGSGRTLERDYGGLGRAIPVSPNSILVEWSRDKGLNEVIANINMLIGTVGSNIPGDIDLGSLNARYVVQRRSRNCLGNPWGEWETREVIPIPRAFTTDLIKLIHWTMNEGLSISINVQSIYGYIANLINQIVDWINWIPGVNIPKLPDINSVEPFWVDNTVLPNIYYDYRVFSEVHYTLMNWVSVKLPGEGYLTGNQSAMTITHVRPGVCHCR
jgi:hypothetical protein